MERWCRAFRLRAWNQRVVGCGYSRSLVNPTPMGKMHLMTNRYPAGRDLVGDHVSNRDLITEYRGKCRRRLTAKSNLRARIVQNDFNDLAERVFLFIPVDGIGLLISFHRETGFSLGDAERITEGTRVRGWIRGNCHK